MNVSIKFGEDWTNYWISMSECGRVWLVRRRTKRWMMIDSVTSWTAMFMTWKKCLNNVASTLHFRLTAGLGFTFLSLIVENVNFKICPMKFWANSYSRCPELIDQLTNFDVILEPFLFQRTDSTVISYCSFMYITIIFGKILKNVWML